MTDVTPNELTKAVAMAHSQNIYEAMDLAAAAGNKDLVDALILCKNDLLAHAEHQMKQETRKDLDFCVRVAIDGFKAAAVLEHGMFATLIESLRYSGTIRVHRSVLAGEQSQLVFDIVCPDSVDSPIDWATANSDRMASFGYNAVIARPVIDDGLVQDSIVSTF